jgi:hypothetical protein
MLESSSGSRPATRSCAISSESCELAYGWAFEVDSAPASGSGLEESRCSLLRLRFLVGRYWLARSECAVCWCPPSCVVKYCMIHDSRLAGRGRVVNLSHSLCACRVRAGGGWCSKGVATARVYSGVSSNHDSATPHRGGSAGARAWPADLITALTCCLHRPHTLSPAPILQEELLPR